jgi:hypothetical protein
MKIQISLIQIKNTYENHSSRLDEVEGRTSGLEEIIHIKEKKQKNS